ncbi:F-box only protein 21-like [Actinia tenebrosa]|uniref:F-box only protein 21-like n=1 Tax=Actinia tenebrosa TaxID=6105 RepID=A0A6P8H8N7_ACTTE|nr:F-box only protein 21-like [Actinia tenebrosa]
MPRAAIQLAVLILAVPLQYFICKWTTPSVGERDILMRKLTRSLTLFSGGILKWDKWKEWVTEFISRFDEKGECPALEVLKHRNPEGYYGQSTEPRSPRPSNVKFRVGQVIRHKKWNYRGVIIGWDEKLNAPDYWRASNHPADKPHWQTMPNYAILVDIRDRAEPQVTYIPEENIEIISNTKIIHDEVDDYFLEFDGAQYLLRPWLRKVYPHD